MSLAYRPDIDGLRAVAVLGVVAFHLGLGALPGGFVGVDVFFVISGYLIACGVQADLAAGRFTLAGFYERRVRRILPALLAMLAVCTPLFALFLVPHDFKAYGQSLAATMLFASNLYFRLRSGYFDPEPDARPLLHTWSLAVEEQYYLVFPVLALLVHRWRPGWLLPVLLSLAALSLAGSQHLVRADANAAFYLTGSRGWELLVGALLSGPRRLPMPARPWREGLAALGALGVMAPMVFYDRHTPFPGLAALLPVTGSALLLWAGGGALQGEPAWRPAVSRVLALPGLVAVGRASYSLYLWHWPVLVAAQYLLMRSLAWPVDIGVYAVVVGLLAWGSWRWVEQPFLRGRLLSRPRPRLFGAAASVGSCFVAVGIGLHVLQGLPQRFAEPGRGYAAAMLDVNPRRAECDRPTPARIAADGVCRIGAPGAGPPDFALFGDSIGDAVMPGLDAAARQAGLRGVTLTWAGCFPLPGVDQDGPACRAFVDAALRYLAERPSIRRVVLAARWSSAYHGDRQGAFDAGGWLLRDDLSLETGVGENARVFERSLRRLLQALGDRELSVVAYLPEQRVDVPRALALQSRYGTSADPSLPVPQHVARQAAVRAVLERLAQTRPLTIVDLGARLCGTERCDILRDGEPLYADDNHLSTRGVLQLGVAWREALGLHDRRDAAAAATR